MPRKFIKRYLPDPAKLAQLKVLGFLGSHLTDPNVWHLNRRSAAGGVALGVLAAWIPLPVQMPVAAFLAIMARVNLPISIAATWITNPFTYAPLYYLAYVVGTTLLGKPAVYADGGFSFTLEAVARELGNIWKPLCLGALICGVTNALVFYGLVRGIWRFQVLRSWQERKGKRQFGIKAPPKNKQDSDADS